jgi:hypothetical protein
MDILYQLFTDIAFFGEQNYGIGKNIRISPWDFHQKDREWERKYIIHPETTFYRGPRSIDELIKYLREHFPEYVRPLFIK